MLRRKIVIENPVLTHGSLCLNTVTRQVLANKQKIILTTKETALLEYLLLHKGRVIKLEEIIEHIWDSNADMFSNSVRVHMSSLRRKLKENLGDDPIQNIIGEGYVIREESK